jgi:predicted nuclease with TOPRIM domain
MDLASLIIALSLGAVAGAAIAFLIGRKAHVNLAGDRDQLRQKVQDEALARAGLEPQTNRATALEQSVKEMTERIELLTAEKASLAQRASRVPELEQLLEEVRGQVRELDAECVRLQCLGGLSALAVARKVLGENASKWVGGVQLGG